jgi:hypothetical protein
MNCVGEQSTVGLLGFDVHGAGPLVVGDDAAEGLRCGVSGAPTQLVELATSLFHLP